MRLAVLALATLSAGPALAQEPPHETFSEELEVREVELLVEPPESLLKQINLDPEDVLVSVDGILRPVTRLSGETPEDWTVAVYVDEVLAPPDTVFLAALALARRAEALAGLGAVEVTVADPGPWPELAANREALRIRQALSELSGRARPHRDDPRPPASFPEAATLRRQCDRLIAWASAPRPPGPRVLFLVADGFPLTPEEQKALASDGDADPSGRAAMLRETARLLAAYGWITVPLPLRETREAQGLEPGRPDSDLDRFRVDHQAGGKYSSGVPPLLPFLKRTSPFRWAGAVALQVEPELAPLRALLAPTGGKLVGLDALLDPLLENLAGRWQLWFQASEPHEGRTRPVEVRLRNGTALRTRSWLRSSTPEEAAAARVRALLLNATGRSEGTLPVRIDPHRIDGATNEIRLTVAPFDDPGPGVPGLVRISWAFADEETPTVHHQMAPGIERPDQGWSTTLTLPQSPGARRLAVAVDDLARERWSGIVLNLPK